MGVIEYEDSYYLYAIISNKNKTNSCTIINMLIRLVGLE